MRLINNVLSVSGAVIAFCMLIFEDSHDPAWMAVALICGLYIKDKKND